MSNLIVTLVRNGDATEADEQDNGQPKCVASGPRSVGSEEGEIEEQPVPADLPPTSSQVLGRTKGPDPLPYDVKGLPG